MRTCFDSPVLTPHENCYCILGTRLGISAHIEDNHRVFTFKFTAEDRRDIDAVLDQSNGRKLIASVGDCGAEYR